jgi:hypothetical protein
MADAEELQDPLKPLDRILSSDPRHRGSLCALENLHSSLDQIRVHAGVPLHVRQLFETAKNLSLHSWFVFRFHPIAKLLGYASLERALKERAAREDGVEVDAVRKTLHPLMARAVASGWLKSEGFESVRRSARVQLRDEQMFGMIQSGTIDEQGVEAPEISEAAILERATQMDYVIRIAESIPYIRNHIAHGGRLLDGGSVVTLRVVAEAINQLFDRSKSTNVNSSAS